MSKKHGRHTAAFLLLFLAEAPSYGAMLLNRLESEMPYCLCDSASVYRSLQEMEKNEFVETKWETQGTGQPRKWYTITPKGLKALEEQATDIAQRRENFEFFLSHWQKVERSLHL